MQLASKPTELYPEPNPIWRLRQTFGGLRIRDRGRVRPRYNGSDPNPGGRIEMARNRMRRTRMGIRARLYMRNRTRLGQRQKRGKSGMGVTVQHDSRRIYKKRGMPRYKKRRWRAFTRKVNFIEEKELGTRTVLFNSQVVGLQDGGSTYHGVVSLSLYSQSSTDQIHNDLNQISSLENTSNPTAAAGDTVDPQSKILFQSAVMDVTIRNTAQFNNGTLASPIWAFDSSLQQEVDVYEVSCSKDFVVGSSTATFYPNVGNAVYNEQGYEKTINNSGSRCNINQRGVTLWECPSALSKLGIKIWKKTKYFIPNQNVITYQVRDPRRHKFTFRDISTEGGANRPGHSRWLVIVYKLVPGIVIGFDQNQCREKLDIGITRKYMYKVEGVKENRSRWINQTGITMISPS